MTSYRVELEELFAFVEKLGAFEQRAEGIAARVDAQIADLHTGWSGAAAAAHRSHHDDWNTAAARMREALAQLREAAHRAHRNYTGAVEMNLEMLS